MESIGFHIITSPTLTVKRFHHFSTIAVTMEIDLLNPLIRACYWFSPCLFFSLFSYLTRNQQKWSIFYAVNNWNLEYSSFYFTNFNWVDTLKMCVRLCLSLILVKYYMHFSVSILLRICFELLEQSNNKKGHKIKKENKSYLKRIFFW